MTLVALLAMARVRAPPKLHNRPSQNQLMQTNLLFQVAA
jgi:hypothetical protein